jgi:hypothetical protein
VSTPAVALDRARNGGSTADRRWVAKPNDEFQAGRKPEGDRLPMDPFLLGIATNLATDLLKVLSRQLARMGVGDADRRSLRQAFARAFEVLLADAVVDPLSGELAPELVTLVEGQLRRLVTDPVIAEMLLAAALEEHGPDLGRLRERFEDLGFDLSTFVIDFDMAMSRFRFALADELSRAAREDQSLSSLSITPGSTNQPHNATSITEH